MQKFPWVGITVATCGIIGFGYIIMKATTPTAEETYASLAPDLRKRVDANREARLSAQNARNKQAAAQLNDPDASQPIWADRQQRS